MKAVRVCVAAILLVCLVNGADYHETILGNCSGNSADNQTIKVDSSMWTVKERFVEYRLNNPRHIRGIKHVDLKSARINFSVVAGGLGTQYVKLHLKSQRGHGINSRLYFYTF